MLLVNIVFLILIALTNLLPNLAVISLEPVANSISVSQLLLDCVNSTHTSRCSQQPKSNTSKNTLDNKDESFMPKRRHKNDINEVCAIGLRVVHDQSKIALVCSPKDSALTEDEANKSPIKVSIKIKNSRNKIGFGSSLTLECRVDATLAKSADMEFRLRWMRSVAGSSGNNQSIISTDLEDSGSDNYIISATTKLWTVQRDGGLDLELNDFQNSDVGSYFCQAISWESDKNIKILSEARMNLDLISRTDDEGVEDLSEHYSHENLSGLLASLTIVPDYLEATPGSKVQLACLTSAQDPDPEASELEWSFESIVNRADLLTRSPSALEQLPNNVSILGNVLVVWSMSNEHSGIYKCKYKQPEFNLTVEASGELTLRESEDSAPLVFVGPELIRLPINGTATIQCEATGYPPSALTWYRLEDSLPSMPVEKLPTNLLTEEPGLELVEVNYPDSSLYCRLNKCLAWPTYKPTTVSLIKLTRARVHHQGQYVCRADNKHGSNQASSVVDVEIREPPKVTILHPSHQVIELANQSESSSSSLGGLKRANATFRCSLDAGHSHHAKLRWLRTNQAGLMATSSRKHLRTNNFSSDILDTYDLTQTSSATSSVSTKFEGPRVLVLEISTSSPDDEGDYVCLAENEWGRASALAHLSVHWPGSVRIVQSSPFIAKPNSSFHLECLASGHPGPLEVEWSRTDRGAFFSLVSRIGPGQERAILKFDRVTTDESGEYTCTAQSATFNGILRDTIMVLIEETPPGNGNGTRYGAGINRELLPKLLVRPSRVSTRLGANVTLDCLAVSGLQPTLVEWLAPPLPGNIDSNSNKSSLVLTSLASTTRLSQFGSRLRISNVTRQHEGVYQCRGRNRLGAELAPALLEILEPDRSIVSTSRLEPSIQTTKSKIARIGSNIELKCQVNGLAASEEQPATSWSRDGLELPEGSVQLGHNLWIRNVSERDSGMYVCSARAQEPNKLHQARVRLEVSGKALEELRARIVASKGQVSAGDSLTLECLIVSSRNINNKTNSDQIHQAQQVSSSDLDQTDLERAVVWTAVESSQSGTAIAFQDNVYIQANLLIIYELRAENAAIYRCHYDELTQSVDYQLQLLNNESQSIGPLAAMSTQSHHNLRQVPFNSRLVLDCPPQPVDKPSEVYWFRGDGRVKQHLPSIGSKLILDPIQVHQADLYQCQATSLPAPHHHTLVQVISPAARFLQRPVSFATLPTIAGADYQLELELSFLPERDSGLILFSGGGGSWNRSSGDYISLGLVRGHLELRFELGDGPTLLRSLHPVQVNHWHRALMERNRRGAVMWLDKQPAVSNSSVGKFFNLNLDSVLYVGGHQSFLTASAGSANKSSASRFRFHGYSRGFQGCIGQLRIGQQQVNILARNRSVTLGLTECDKPECDNQRRAFCGSNGVCQAGQSMSSRGIAGAAIGMEPEVNDAQQKQKAAAEPRCICFPGFTGDRCDRQVVSTPTITPAPKVQTNTNPIIPANTSHTKTVLPSSGAACETLNPCSHNGTLKCHSLSSSSFKCHCLLGFVGETCNSTANFSSETSVWFNQQAYLQLRLNLINKQENQEVLGVGSKLNNIALNSMAENQNISFKLRTNSSYGLIFYTGQTYAILEDGAPLELGAQSQTSKSMVANLLARLFSTVTDYLAVALVDGHVELSFELGSGVAIIRSSERVNDSREHQIRVIRNGRHAKLLIDDLHKHEGSSPGKLSALNGPADVYLGGLPHLAELTHNMYVSGFVGCVSSLEINSLGPFNLIKSDQLSQVRAARNLAPCSSWTSTSIVRSESNFNATSNHSIVSQTAAAYTQQPYRPYKPQTQTPEMDDSDEM